MIGSDSRQYEVQLINAVKLIATALRSGGSTSVGGSSLASAPIVSALNGIVSRLESAVSAMNAINNKLDLLQEALYVTEETEGEDPAKRSLAELMKESLFITEEPEVVGDDPVEKGLAEIFIEKMDAMRETLVVTEEPVVEGDPVVETTIAQLVQESTTTLEDKLESIRGTMFIEIPSELPDEDPTEKSFSQILSEQNEVLENVRDSVYDDSGLTPVGVLTKLTDIEEVQEDIKDALDGTNASGISAKVDLVATNVQQGDASIVTALGGVNATLVAVEANTSNTADRLLYGGSQPAATILQGIYQNTDSLETKMDSVNTNLGTVNTSVVGVSTAVGTANGTLSQIHTDTTSIDGKIQ